MEMHPEELFSKLYEKLSTRKKRTLVLIHNACKKQAKSSTKDFSIAAIARLVEDAGGITEQALRNKNGEEYRALIHQWDKYCREPKKARNSIVYDELLASISDPTTRSLVGILIAENKQLKKENSLLRRQIDLLLDSGH